MGRFRRYRRFRRHRKRWNNYQRFQYQNNQFNAKRTFYQTNSFVRRHPLVSAVTAIIVSIILIRISFLDSLFGYKNSEFRMWFLFFAVLVGIIGFIAIRVWMRNNVSDLTTRHSVDWKNR